MAKKKNEPKQEDKVEQQVEPETVEQTEAEAPEQPAEPSIDEILAEHKENYLRLAAEYDNFRKRTAKEREQLFATAKAATITALLPVYDNLERAVAQECADEAYKKGVEMTLTQFVQSLESIGVKMIDSAKGSPFDPEKHNAVMHIEDDSYGQNVIVETFQKGFETDGKVIRHAVVQVAN